MHSAYNLGSLLKLPHAIQSMASFGEFLLVGTKQGHLLMYLVKFNEPLPGNSSQGLIPGSDDRIHSSLEPSFEASVQLLKSNTDYKKPIMQMDVHEVGVKQYILVVLCDGIVAVHYISQKESSVPSISAATRMPHPKGAATAFSLDVVRQKTLTGELSSVIRIAVAFRKKLQFFYWKREKFHELHAEVTLPHETKSLVWFHDSVCVGFSSGYSLIKLNKAANEIRELAMTPQNNTGSVSNKTDRIFAPNVTLLSEEERFALADDKVTKFIDLEGSGKGLPSITWSDSPVSLAQDSPYLICLLRKSVEIRTDSPQLLVQTIDISDAKLVCSHRPGLIFLASTSQVWFLRMISTYKQISQLVLDKQFELAIRLCNLNTTENTKQKSDRIREIQTLLGFDQFCNGKFKEAMDVFFKLDIDPTHVIGLFSDLLPSEFCSQLKYPSKVPPLEKSHHQSALLALIEFLTQVRHKLNGITGKKVMMKAITEGPVIESKAKLMEIIDTTLLKCYIMTKAGSLVASLLRLKENQCHLEEAERTLKKNKMFKELIILYNTRGLHRKALTLLKDHINKEDSPLQGHEKMIEYLQNLTSEHIDIICEFAAIIIETSHKDGLGIFTEDLLEVENWPRGKILDFLSKTESCRSLVVPYLEHIISTWHEKGPLFHNSLIIQYKDVIVPLLQKSAKISVDEYKVLQETRQKLKDHLTKSTCYTAEAVLPQLPDDFLFEERALLLASLGRHMEAIAIYLYLLADVKAAFDYAMKQDQAAKAKIPAAEAAFVSNTGTSSNGVWTILFRMLMAPPDGPTLRKLKLPKNLPNCKPDLPNALRVLSEHGDKVDLMTVLLSTPDDVQLSQLSPYLEAAMDKAVSRRHHTQLSRGLMQAKYLQVHEERIAVESQKIVLTDLDTCPVCLKKFRNQGTLVRFPNGRLVHFSCQERALIVA